MNRVVLSALLLALALPVFCQQSAWLPMPETNPLDFGTLRMSPFESWDPPRGKWWTSATTSYFNDWSGSWHARTIHVELHREHQPLDSDELRLLEQRGPTDDIFQLDVEGWRFDAVAARGLGWGTLLIRAGAFGIGAPRWDAIGERAHQVLHADQQRRIFPRSQTVVYVRSSAHRVELRDEIRRFDLANPSVSLGIPLRVSRRWDNRVVFAAQVPVARHDSTNLASSGGWDAGVRWLTTGRILGFDALAGAGYTRTDRGAAFYGFPRSDLWHAMAELSRPVGRFSFIAAARIDRSILGGAMHDESGRPDLDIAFGIGAPLRRGRVSFSVGENVPSVGLGADWSFHLQYTPDPR